MTASPHRSRDPIDRIPVAGPWITDLEVEYVTEAVRGAWYGGAGEFTRRFETAFAAYTGRRHAVSLPSATSGLHLALAALGIGPGDEVVVPDLTWVATAAPVSYVGADVVFADVDAETWCVRPDALEACITERTRAVIVVDLYGGMPDMDAIGRVAADAGIAVIEDAAEAVGAAIGDRPAGSFGVASVFSFHGSKTLTTGEGGMLVTDDADLLARVDVLRDHGRAPGTTDFRNVEVGFKYKMSSLQAALGLAQLERVDALVDRKRAIFGWYAERLGRPEITLNAEPAGTTNGYWMVTAVLDAALGIDKVELRDRLSREGIDTRPMFDPLSAIPAYAGTAAARNGAGNVIAHGLSPYGINLPSALNLTEAEVDRVCATLVASIGAG